MSTELGRVIQLYRERAKLTQDELGKNIGVSQQTIAKWESGKSSPRPKALELLIRALNISSRDLKELYPESAIQVRKYDFPEALANMILEDDRLYPFEELRKEASPNEVAPRSIFSQIANSSGLKKLLMPVVSEIDASSSWDQIVPGSGGNIRVDYANDELFAQFLHAPSTASLTLHLRSSIYRLLWRYATMSGVGLTHPSRYLLIVITLPEDQSIDLGHKIPGQPTNTRMLRRLTSEALAHGISIVLARSLEDTVSVLTNSLRTGDPGWDWPGHEWDEDPD